MKTLKQLRRERKLNLDELSKATGINISTLSKLQTGKQTPSVSQRNILEKFFGEPFKYVTDYEIEHAERMLLEDKFNELDKAYKELLVMYLDASNKIYKIENILSDK